MCISTDGKNTVFSRNNRVCPAGSKPLYGDKGHKGIDLVASHGQPIFAAQRGFVYKIDPDPKSGLDVRIESTEGPIRFRHIYEHLLGHQVRVGDAVETGQLIGWADNTGYSSGNHLHFQVELYVAGEWHPIDPMPYMANAFAPDILKVTNTIKYIRQKLALLAERLSDRLNK